jgi:hypothetical protein
LRAGLNGHAERAKDRDQNREKPQVHELAPKQECEFRAGLPSGTIFGRQARGEV